MDLLYSTGKVGGKWWNRRKRNSTGWRERKDGQMERPLDSLVKQQISGDCKKGKLEVLSEGQSVFIEENEGFSGISGIQGERSEEEETSAAKSRKP